MERLTEEVYGKYIRIKGTKSLYERYERDGAPLSNAIARLASYEDTGLEPEKIITLCDMDRRAKIADMLRLEESAGISIDRLRKLAQAKKKGRLVVLPCDVGDTVYRVGASICKWREIDHCDEYCDGWQYRDCWEGTRAVLEEKFSLCDLESIGKTVFLTCEAAEAALEEREVD